MRCWKEKLKLLYICTYLLWQSTMRLIFNLGDWFPCAFFNRRNSPAYCYTLLKTTKDFVKVWQFHRRIRYKKKFKPPGNWKIQPSMVYKLFINDMQGQVAHHSWGTWGLEGDNGHGATSWTNDGHQPRLRLSFDGNRQPFPIHLPYVRRLVTSPNSMVTVPMWQTRLSV